MTDADFKRDVRERVFKARKDGITIGEMRANLEDQMGVHAILNVFEGWKNSMRTWRNLDEMLRKLGY